MGKKPYDPLAAIASADTIRNRLLQSIVLTDRLQTLLDLAEQLEMEGRPETTGTLKQKLAFLEKRLVDIGHNQHNIKMAIRRLNRRIKVQELTVTPQAPTT